MIFLIAFAALLRLALTALVTYKLFRWAHMLNAIERFGLGIMGGSGFLTIPVIIDGGRAGTPFDVWAGMLFSMGVMLYLVGRLSRHIRHEGRNVEAVEQARTHLVSRGKL